METEIKSKILPTLVVAVDLKQVVIICPFCGKFHWHGSGGDNTETNYGTRVPHCTEEIAIINNKHDQYELITSENTIRREKILPKDLTVWRSRQRSVRRAVEERWRLQEEADRDERILEAVREIHLRVITRGVKMTRFRIAHTAEVAPICVTRWLNKHGIYYEDGQYRVFSASKAGPELCEIFGQVCGCGITKNDQGKVINRPP